MGGPRTSYADEQAQLRKRHEGEPADDVRIVIPKDPEVRPEVYRDVESLIFRGFITARADINGVLFVFKSLNHHEFELLRLIGGIDEGAPPDSFWNLFLSYGVFVVDGANVLADRDASIPKLVEAFKGMPHRARQRIVRHLSEVNRKAANAVTMTEAYTMELFSRFRWGQFQGVDLTSTAVTGVAGTEHLGLNWAQLLWRALNHFEDEHKRVEQDWEHAKFVGSCFAGKGLSKIYSQDERRREKEREERATRKDAILRHVLLGDPLDTKDAKGGVQVQSAHTVEELASQLEADLRGEKDFHDRVVEAQEARVRQGYTERRQQLSDLVKQREREYDGKPLMGQTDIGQGLSSDEVKQRIRQSKQLQAQQAAARIVYPELEDPKLAGFLDKWGVVGPTDAPPQIEMTDRDVSNVVPLPPARGPGTPFRR